MHKIRRKELDTEIRSVWFKDHVATYRHYRDENGDKIDFLRWGNPISNIYSIQYMFRTGLLCVYGDLGDAVYQWHPSIGNIQQLANLSIDYFASKCQASEVGRSYQTWDEDCAKEYMLSYLADCIDADDENTLANKASEKFNALGGWRSLWCESEWIQWLSDYGPEFFTDDYTEHGRIGMEIDSRCRSHLIGLNMAFKQLECQQED